MTNKIVLDYFLVIFTLIYKAISIWPNILIDIVHSNTSHILFKTVFYVFSFVSSNNCDLYHGRSRMVGDFNKRRWQTDRGLSRCSGIFTSGAKKRPCGSYCSKVIQSLRKWRSGSGSLVHGQGLHLEVVNWRTALATAWCTVRIIFVMLWHPLSIPKNIWN